MNVFKSLALLLFLGGFILGCSTGGDQGNEPPLNLEGQWTEVNLPSQSVSRIKISNQILYASSRKGLYKQEISSSKSAWQLIGFQEADVRDFIVWNKSEILVSAEFPDSTVFIFRTLNGGKKWEAFQNGFGGDINRIPSTLKKGLQNSDVIFGRRGNNVAKARDKGKSWSNIYLNWASIGAGPFIRQTKNTIWAGGTNSIFEPQLIKSPNGGDSWEQLTVIENVETTVYDVAIHPSDENTIIAGLDIGIRKSTDGGRIWTTTFQQVGVLTFANSARDGSIVYAAGNTSDGRLSFFASSDFGDTWQQVEMPDSPAGMQVNDMISVTEDGQEVLYFGTNKGVFSYAFEE